jgi:hypothetical protein
MNSEEERWLIDTFLARPRPLQLKGTYSDKVLKKDASIAKAQENFSLQNGAKQVVGRAGSIVNRVFLSRTKVAFSSIPYSPCPSKGDDREVPSYLHGLENYDRAFDGKLIRHGAVDPSQVLEKKYHGLEGKGSKKSQKEGGSSGGGST